MILKIDTTVDIYHIDIYVNSVKISKYAVGNTIECYKCGESILYPCFDDESFIKVHYMRHYLAGELDDH